MTDPILISQDLHKTFNGTKAVQGVSFQIAQGEIYSLLGPNGAGKTTTISMLTGLLAPTQGDAVIDGHSVVKNVNDEADDAAALETIKAAEAELNSGTPFADVANKHSDCSGQGGSLGWFPLGEMVEEFEEVVSLMEPGQVSDVFRSGFGWHIATLHEKKPEGVRPLEEVKEQIVAALSRGAQEKALEEFVDALRAKADVKTVKKP